MLDEPVNPFADATVPKNPFAVSPPADNADAEDKPQNPFVTPAKDDGLSSIPKSKAVMGDFTRSMTRDEQSQYVDRHLEATKKGVKRASNVDRLVNKYKSLLYGVPGVPPGIGEVAGEAASGLSHAYLADKQKNLEVAQGMKEGTIQPPTDTAARAAAKAIAKEVLKIPTEAVKAVETLRYFSDPSVHGTYGNLKNDPVFKMATGYEKFLDKIGLKPQPGRGSDLPTQLAQGGVTIAEMLAPAAIATKAGAGVNVARAATTAAGAALQMNQGVDDAIEHNADDNAILMTAIANAGLGVTDAIPLFDAVSIYRKAAGPGVVKPMAKAIAATALKASRVSVEEGLQEFGQQLGQNYVAKKLYDPDRAVAEGAFQAGLVGGILGFGMGAGGHAHSAMRDAMQSAITARKAADALDEKGDSAAAAAVLKPATEKLADATDVVLQQYEASKEGPDHDTVIPENYGVPADAKPITKTERKAAAAADNATAIHDYIHNKRQPKPLNKFPVIALLKRAGGVKIGSLMDTELKNIGLTTKNMPGLFRKNGKITDGDNFVHDDSELLSDAYEGDGHGYYTTDEIVDAVGQEVHGKPLRTSKEREIEADEAYKSDFIQQMDRAGIDPDQATVADIQEFMDTGQASHVGTPAIVENPFDMQEADKADKADKAENNNRPLESQVMFDPQRDVEKTKTAPLKEKPLETLSSIRKRLISVTGAIRGTNPLKGHKRAGAFYPDKGTVRFIKSAKSSIGVLAHESAHALEHTKEMLPAIKKYGKEIGKLDYDKERVEDHLGTS